MTPPTDALIDVGEAQRRIAASIAPLPDESVPTAQAGGRVLREDVHASRDQPPFDRATMDGIALSSKDTARELTVTGIGAAGAPPLAYAGPGTCVEIMTGAVVPQGCDCVVPVERLTRHEDRAMIDADARREAGTFVHPRGSDHTAGTTLLSSGTRLDAAALAVLVSTGREQVRVSRVPALCVLASGDELIDLGQPVADYQVRRSNDYAAAALLSAHGWRDVTRAHVRDDREAVEAAVARALEFDAVILTGGVSKGRYDYLPEALEAGGVTRVFHRVAQRPGKPMWFGTGPAGQLVFALPGNPVSALTCLRRYVLSTLRQLSGEAHPPPASFAVLDDDVSFKPSLTWLAAACRVESADGTRRVRVRRVNTSGDFTGLVGTHGIVELPANVTEFAAGTPVRWFAW
ncbi:MAG: molybdopterin molybdotransferase MoeA [Pseudomonadota bacterium]